MVHDLYDKVIEQIFQFNDLCMFETSEQLCQLFYSFDLQKSSEFHNNISFLWADTLFRQQRYHECITLCGKINNVRCTYLKGVCLERLGRYHECIEVCNSVDRMIGFSLLNTAAFYKNQYDILSKKISLPTEHSFKFLLAKCYEKLGVWSECSNCYKSAFKSNSADIFSFCTLLTNSFDKSVRSSDLFRDIWNEGTLRTASPASQITLSINKRLSISNSQKELLSSNSPKKSRSIRKTTDSPVLLSTTLPVKKAFQKRLFGTEENHSNKQKFTEDDVLQSKEVFSSNLAKEKCCSWWSENVNNCHSKLFLLVYYFCKKQYKECLKIIEELGFSPNTTDTSNINSESPYLLSLIGTCYYECMNYERSKIYFQQIFQSFPYFVKYLQIYSSVLWHLKDVQTLSFVTKSLMAWDSKSEDSWLAYGNLLSAKKDWQNAIKAFQKAIKINSKCAYAYVLCGYEYLSCDDLENAVASFLECYKINGDYKALFGIALVAIKESQWEKAIKYLYKAKNINPENSIIFYYLGLVHENIGNYDQSLIFLSETLSIDPSNYPARFKKARLLYKLRKFQDALNEAMVLLSADSNEPAVYLLLGRLYKELGDQQESIRWFTWGTSLQSDFASIKKELEEIT